MSYSERRATALAIGATAALLIGVMALHIWYYFFLCDDAYIAFRYARNLAHGHGLVFNVGEPVEGYTSLLWVVQLAVGYLLGVSGEVFPHLLSLAYTAAALVLWSLFVYRQQAPSRWAVILLVLLSLAVNRTWAIWATSGLETRCFTFFTLLAFYFLTRAEQAQGRRRLIELMAVSLALALATLARPDAQAFVPLVVAFCLLTRRRGVAEMLALIAPFALLVGTHYAWRFAYYGAWLPNTYYAKVGKPWPEMGWRYLAAFALEYAYYLILPFIALTWLRVESQLSRRLALLFVACMAVHAAYYCYWAGGDHFEFRIFDFYAPLIAWMIAEGLVACYRVQRLATIAAGAALLVYSLAIPTTIALGLRGLQPDEFMKNAFVPRGKFKVVLDDAGVAGWLPGMRRIVALDGDLLTELNAHLVSVRQEFHRLGWLAFRERVELAAGVGPDLLPEMPIVSWNIGTLGYFVDLPVIDLFGLTDAIIARNPAHLDWRFMAHERTVPPGYLDARRAHVIVSSATRAPLPQGPAAPLFGRATRSYSIRLPGGVWLNVLSWDPQWMASHFQETPTEVIPLSSKSAG